MPEKRYNNRVLIVDDNEAIHDDFVKILAAPDAKRSELDALLSDVFEDEGTVGKDAEPTAEEDALLYDISHAYQGKESYDMALEANRVGMPFALVYMDVRMPPGWDGIKTIRTIWKDMPHTEIVICTAYSDYAWDVILQELGSSDQLQFVRKPFDVVSIRQMTLALVRKWNLARQARDYVRDLEQAVAERTRELNEKVDEITRLRGILPMCAYCHKVRTDEDYWERVDEYINSRSLAEISHGVCPECRKKLMEDFDEDGAAPTAG